MGGRGKAWAPAAPGLVCAAIKRNWWSIPAIQYIAMQAGGLGDALAFTVTSVLVTVAIGAALGTVLGIALPHISLLRLTVTPALVVLGSTPLLILLPFLVQWFGTGRFVRSGIVIIFTFVLMSTVCIKSSEQAVGSYGQYARSLGAKPAFEMWHGVFPALFPDLLAGLRVALSAAWSLEAVVEIVGGKNGSGRIIGTMAHLANTNGDSRGGGLPLRNGRGGRRRPHYFGAAERVMAPVDKRSLPPSGRRMPPAVEFRNVSKRFEMGGGTGRVPIAADHLNLSI